MREFEGVGEAAQYLATAKTGRPWSQSAALVALADSDDDITAYIRTGRTDAAGQDDRGDVENLALLAGSVDIRAAAAKALDGDDATVSAFLAAGQYEAMKQGMRVAVAQTVANAGPIEQQAGRTVLDADTPDALRQFLTTGDTQARTQDERVRAAQLVDPGNQSTGPELKAAAHIALEGPSGLLHAFITVGQYKARRQDQLTAVHEAQIQRLIAQAAGTASTAQKNAAEAGKAAATAAKASSEAAGYAKQADQSAKDAQKYATQAETYATQADQSAKDAATSADTARNAQLNAENAAASAVTSATSAQYSASSARDSADAAWTASQNARISATAAGKDSVTARKAATEAYHSAVLKQQEAAKQWQQWYEEQKKQQGQQNDDSGWIPGWLKDTANTVGDYTAAILGNPDVWAGMGETGLSLLSIGVGAGGDLGGGALCITGIGCLAGAPAIAASTTLVVGGAYGVADGINRFSDGLGQALREADDASRGTGASRGAEAGALGKQREEYVADLIGGRVAKYYSLRS